MADLCPAGNKKSKLEGHTLVQTRDSVSTVTVHCPSAGDFTVNLFGRPLTTNVQKSGGLSYEFLMAYTIRTKAGKPGRPPHFPTRFTAFIQLPRAYIFSPISGNLVRRSQPIKFHLLLPTAKKVAVVVDKKWTQLQQCENDEWKGEVDLAVPSLSSASVAQVFGQFPAEADENFDPFHYAGLLKYSIH